MNTNPLNAPQDQRPLLSYERQQDLWKTISFQSVPMDVPETQPYIDTLKQTYNKVLFQCFRVSDNQYFDFYASHSHLFDQIEFPKHFLTMISETSGLSTIHEDALTFSVQNGFIFGGELARMLYEGGAYGNYDLSARDAKTLADNFSKATTREQYDKALIWVNNQAWSDWFFDIVWDSTWVLLDIEVRLVWLLMATDID